MLVSRVCNFFVSLNSINNFTLINYHGTELSPKNKSLKLAHLGRKINCYISVLGLTIKTYEVYIPQNTQHTRNELMTQRN